MGRGVVPCMEPPPLLTNTPVKSLPSASCGILSVKCVSQSLHWQAWNLSLQIGNIGIRGFLRRKQMKKIRNKTVSLRDRKRHDNSDVSIVRRGGGGCMVHHYTVGSRGPVWTLLYGALLYGDPAPLNDKTKWKSVAKCYLQWALNLGPGFSWAYAAAYAYQTNKAPKWFVAACYFD